MRSATVMDDTGLRHLARQAIAPGTTAPLGVYVFGADDLASELARHVERVVFMETFGNTTELLVKEYAPYDQASIFVCVIDHLRCVPAGTMRILLPSEAGFKTLDDAAPVWGEPVTAMAARTGIELDLARTWDIATLAVAPEYRGKATMGLVSMGLYQALALATPPCGIDWLLAILDVPVFRMIRWKLRMPMAGFTGVAARPYLGSAASMPVWCNVGDTERRLAMSDPDLHALYFKGVGMEPAIRPLDVARAIDLVAPASRSTMPSPAARSRSASKAS
jgi:hypothetical protein